MSLDLEIFVPRTMSQADHLVLDTFRKAVEVAQQHKEELDEDLFDVVRKFEWHHLDPIASALTKVVVGDHNCTHNLNRLASHLGVYTLLWGSQEPGGHLVTDEDIALLDKAIATLKSSYQDLIQFEPANKWGTVQGFLAFLEKIRMSVEEGRELGPVYFRSDT